MDQHYNVAETRGRVVMRSKVVCFSGVDGSGKSAHARYLFNELRATGTKCKYKWLRYPHFLSLLPLVFYEFGNLKRKPNPGLAEGEKLIKTKIKSNRLIVAAWVLTMFVDSFFSMIGHAYLPVLLGYTVILDRFVVDTLLDTAFNLKKERLIFGTAGRMFLSLVPKNSIVLILDVEENLAALRKGSVEDVNFSRKRAVYKHLSKIYHWNVISTEEAFPQVHRRILELVN